MAEDGDTLRRRLLQMPANAAQLAANTSAMIGPRPSWGVQTLNTAAMMTAPRVWPVRRAVPSMPLAAPLRCRGAEVTMVWLLGDWNKPNPMPHSAMRQAMSRSPGCAGSAASSASPQASRPSPMPPSSPSG